MTPAPPTEPLAAGQELDALIAQAFEPRESLPVISAHAARLREWGPDPERWRWVSCHAILSPGEWWEAEIGSDHGDCRRDHEPVRWRVNSDLCPSTDPGAAWRLLLPQIRTWPLDRQEAFYDALCDQWHTAEEGRNAVLGDTDEALTRHLFDSAFRWFLFRADAPFVLCLAALAAVAGRGDGEG